MTETPVSFMFRAFSDVMRLRILHLLSAGELCVGDLVKVLKAPQPTVSRHLAYLRRSRLVVTRRNGLWNYYQLAPAKSAFHRDLLTCLRSCGSAVPKVAQDGNRLKSIQRTGGCCPNGS